MEYKQKILCELLSWLITKWCAYVYELWLLCVQSSTPCGNECLSFY